MKNDIERLTRERDKERKHVARLMRDLEHNRKRAENAEARLAASQEPAPVAWVGRDHPDDRWTFLRNPPGEGAWAETRPLFAAPVPPVVGEDAVEHMVSRFLHWKLPENFNPDGGIQFIKTTDFGHMFEPVGTNLLDYQQAKAMVLHMLGGLPSLLPSTPVESDELAITDKMVTTAFEVFSDKMLMCDEDRDLIRRMLIAALSRSSGSTPAEAAFRAGFDAGEAVGKFDDDNVEDAWKRYVDTFPAPAALASSVAKPCGVEADIEAQAWNCDQWPEWLHDIVARTNEVADRLDMSSEQAHAYAILSCLSCLSHPAQGWRGAEAPLTKTELAEALSCFWNAAIGEAHNKQDSTAFATIGAMAEGIAAVERRLRELPSAPAGGSDEAV